MSRPIKPCPNCNNSVSFRTSKSGDCWFSCDYCFTYSGASDNKECAITYWNTVHKDQLYGDREILDPKNRIGEPMSKIKDSGKTQEFNTGAHRDSDEGKGRFDLIPYEALQRLAVTYQNGATKYGENNWKKGMPIERFLDSGSRHLYKYMAGWRDEDHLSMALWNICGAIFMEEHPEILEKIEGSKEGNQK